MVVWSVIPAEREHTGLESIAACLDIHLFLQSFEVVRSVFRNFGRGLSRILIGSYSHSTECVN